MVKKFLANLLLLLVANLIVKPFWIFAIDRVVQNQVGQESYGLYIALFNLCLLPGILLDLGINQYSNTAIAKENTKVSALWGSLSSIKLILGGFYIITIAIAAILLGYYHQLYLLLPIAINQCLLGFLLYIRVHFSALHLFKTDTALSISDKLLMILFCGPILWLGWFGGITIEKFIYIQCLASAVSIGIGYLLLRRITAKATPNIGQTNFKKIWKESKPYAILALIMVIYTRADTIILQQMLPDGNAQVGMYAQSYRLLDALNMVAVLSASLLLPIFSKTLAQKETTYQLSRVAFILLVFPAISLAALCFVSSSDMMVLLYKTPSYFSRSIFPILMLSFIPICANYVYGTLITANGNLGFLNKLSLFVLLLNVILNYMLIPSLKAEGTAIASLVTHSVLCVSYLLFCVTHKLININIKFIAKTLAYAAIVITCAYLVARFSLQIKVLLLAVASVVSLWILRLVSYQELLKILPSRLKNNIE